MAIETLRQVSRRIGHQASTAAPKVEFVQFPELPEELRRAIWNMAICTDDTPRIHYYSLYHSDEHGRRKNRLQCMLEKYNSDKSHMIEWPGSRRVPRLVSKPGSCAWTSANRFLYPKTLPPASLSSGKFYSLAFRSTVSSAQRVSI